MSPVDVASSKEGDLFFPDLQLQRYDEAALEVHFVSRLVFKVYDVVSEALTFHPLSQGRGPTSYYAYWNSDPKIHTLQYEKILGVVGIAIQFTRLMHRQPLPDFP